MEHVVQGKRLGPTRGTFSQHVGQVSFLPMMHHPLQAASENRVDEAGMHTFY